MSLSQVSMMRGQLPSGMKERNLGQYRIQGPAIHITQPILPICFKCSTQVIGKHKLMDTIADQFYRLLTLFKNPLTPPFFLTMWSKLQNWSGMASLTSHYLKVLLRGGKMRLSEVSRIVDSWHQEVIAALLDQWSYDMNTYKDVSKTILIKVCIC